MIEVPESALKGIANNPNVAFIEANVVHEHAFSSVASWGLDRIDQDNLPHLQLTG